jgi:hypothetical protein
MRGAPQVGFSAAMRKIKARISLLTAFRPLMGPVLESHFQYNRKPARCHSTTVLGVTRSRGFSHPAQSCCRRARFSRMRSSRDLKTLTTQPKRCRSHTIIAKNLTGFQQVGVSAKSLILRMHVVLTRTMRSVGKRTSLQGPTAASALSPSPRSARRAYLRPDRWESICLPTPAARCFLAALGALEPRERNVFR